MAAAIRDPDPVIFCEHKGLLRDEGRGARRRARRRRSGRRGSSGRDRRDDRCPGGDGPAGRRGGGRLQVGARHRRRGHRPPLARAARHDDDPRLGRRRRAGSSPSRRTRGSAAGAPRSSSIVADEGFSTSTRPIVRITTPHMPLRRGRGAGGPRDPVGRADRRDGQAGGWMRPLTRDDRPSAVLGTGRMGAAMAGSDRAGRIRPDALQPDAEPGTGAREASGAPARRRRRLPPTPTWSIGMVSRRRRRGGLYPRAGRGARRPDGRTVAAST